MKQIKILNPTECQTRMEDWIKCEGTKLPSLDETYKQIRADLQGLFKETEKSIERIKGRNDYFKDVDFGVRMYKYFEQQPWFNLRVASNIGFWRYLSIMVIPDIVEERWGYDNEDHYWKKPTRIWLRSIWWYIYIANDDNLKETESMLLKDRFSTDTILNLIERSGRDGTNITVYKNIIKVYSLIDKDTLNEYKKKSKKGDDLFRAVMRLNTARSVVIEPDFCDGGSSGYVISLFNAFGVSRKHMIEFKQ